MINGGGCVNIISWSAIESMDLKSEPHPYPYNVIQVDKSFHFIIQCCFISIQFLSYNGRIWCDVLHMNTTHILLGRPYLFDLVAKNY